MGPVFDHRSIDAPTFPALFLACHLSLRFINAEDYQSFPTLHSIKYISKDYIAAS